MLIPPPDSKVLIKKGQENLVAVINGQEYSSAKEKRLLREKEQKNILALKKKQKAFEKKKSDDELKNIPASKKEQKAFDKKKSDDILENYRISLEKKIKEMLTPNLDSKLPIKDEQKDEQKDFLFDPIAFEKKKLNDILDKYRISVKKRIKDILSDAEKVRSLRLLIDRMRLPFKSKVNEISFLIWGITDISPKISPLILRLWYLLYFNRIEKDIRVIEKSYYDIYGHNFSWFDNPNLIIVITGRHISFHLNSEKVFKKGDIIIKFIIDPYMKKLKPSERKDILLDVEQILELIRIESNLHTSTERLLDCLAIHWHEQEYKYLELDIWKIKKLFFERFGFNLYWLEEDKVVTFKKGIINFTRSDHLIENTFIDFKFVIQKVEPSITEDIKEKEKKKNEEKDEDTDENHK